jgi:hypothetical protein
MRKRELPPGSAADQWLNAIAPTLGSSVTRITQTGPAELSFNRTAQGGFTAVELIALADWLEAPNFPGCDLDVQKLPLRQFHGHLKKLSAPAPAPH